MRETALRYSRVSMRREEVSEMKSLAAFAPSASLFVGRGAQYALGHRTSGLAPRLSRVSQRKNMARRPRQSIISSATSPVVAATTPWTRQWVQVIKYRIEMALSWHVTVRTGLLWLVFFAVVAIGGYLYQRATGFDTGKAYWRAWCSLSGSEPDFSEDPFSAKVVVFCLTILQFLFFAVLVGFVEQSLSSKFDELRGGRTAVVERDHEVILGWNSRLPRILRQVAIAGSEDNVKVRVVVLANKSKAFMDEQIQELVSRGEFKDVNVVTRSGDPTSPRDQKIVAIDKARKVVILSQAEDGLHPKVADNLSFTTTLALKHSGHAGSEGSPAIVETRGLPRTSQVARLGGNVIELNWPDLVSRHLVKCALQPPGLAQVHRELLDFEGVEVHVKSFPSLKPMPFDSFCVQCQNGIPIGLYTGTSGSFTLNPSPQTQVTKDDQFLILAKNKKVLSLATKAVPKSSMEGIRVTSINDNVKAPKRNILVLGWRPGMSSILDEIEGSTGPGSEVTIVTQARASTCQDELTSERFDRRKELKNIKRVNFFRGDPCDVRDLKSVLRNSKKYHAVMVLLDHSSLAENDQQRESRVLESLSAMRIAKNSKSSHHVVAEVFAANGEDLARAEHPESTVVSLDEVSALLMAQAAYEPQVLPVLRTLLSQRGPEIALRKPDWAFNTSSEKVSFKTLQGRLRQRNETLIGYISNEDTVPGVSRLHPDPDQQLSPVDVEHLVVIADDYNAIWADFTG